MLRRELWWVVWAAVALTLLCLGCELVCHFALHLPFVYSFPLLPRWGGDFRSWIGMMRKIHTPAFETTFVYPFLYPPAAAPFQYVFSILPWNPTLFFYLACLAVVAASAAAFAKALVRVDVKARQAAFYAAALVAFSYPLWFCLRQGNIEILLFGVIAFGVRGYLRGQRTAAAVCFGIAGAAKLYPFLLLGLFVSERKWRYVGLAILTAFLATLGSLWLIHPNLRIAIQETKAGLAFANWLQFLHMNPSQGGFDHSVLGAIKRMSTALPAPDRMRPLVNLYIVCFGVLGLAAYIWRLRRAPLLNQLLGLIAAMVTFMPLSYDYTLLHMYIPFGLLALEIQKGAAARLSSTLQQMLACFVLLFAPLSEFIFHATTFSGLIKTAALLWLFVIAVARPLHPGAEVLEFATTSATEDRSKRNSQKVWS